MREFFRGRKRKTGVATLLMACVFAAGWFSSKLRCDKVGLFHTVVILSGGDVLTICAPSRTARVAVELTTHGFSCPAWITDDPSVFQWEELTFGDTEFTSIKYSVINDDWERTTDQGTTGVELPYWYIVLPLTLMSAYLLLSKPRQPKNQTDDVRNLSKTFPTRYSRTTCLFPHYLFSGSAGLAWFCQSDDGFMASLQGIA